MELGLENKVVVVTASSKGLGFATALEFAKEGANVVISSRDKKNLVEASKNIKDIAKGKILAIKADLLDENDMENLFNKTIEEFGTVHILVNNTGGPKAGSFDNISDEDWQRAFEQVLLSMIRCIRKAIPFMKKQIFGRIINFASSSFKQPIDNLILSNTFRTGILGLAKTLSVELAPFNILINTLGPGRIETERVKELDQFFAEKNSITYDEAKSKAEMQVPAGRYGKPEELAKVATFLCSAANTYVTGQSFLVDGGLIRAI
jgi:3-oxoacyl-[acyl-carrier protein] reductase